MGWAVRMRCGCLGGAEEGGENREAVVSAEGIEPSTY